MKFYKETEKAGMIGMNVEWYNSERSCEYKVWVPKSQIRNGKLTKWIANAKAEEKTFGRGDCLVRFTDADGAVVETECTAADRKAVREINNELKETFGRLRFKAC